MDGKIYNQLIKISKIKKELTKLKFPIYFNDEEFDNYFVL
jgi:hypothetical protein